MVARVSARSSAGKSGRPPSTPSRSEADPRGYVADRRPSPAGRLVPCHRGRGRDRVPLRARPAAARDPLCPGRGSGRRRLDASRREIVDTRFSAFGSVDALSQRADQQNHGALSVGPALQNWSPVDPVRQPVRLTINGTVRFDGIGENSAVDPVRVLVWLANHGTHAFGGLRAGHVVTTGSCTGTIFVEPGTHIAAAFPGLGAIEIEIS